MAWETTSTSSPARRARPTRRSSSSVLPANIGPTITCRRPAKVADMRPGYAAARRRYGTPMGTTMPSPNVPASGRTSRQLPSYAAGAFDVPSRILGGQEVISQDTVWEEHSHPTHELLWNERGASTARIGSRMWTITSRIGLWIPAALPPAPGPIAVELTPLLRLLMDRLIHQTLSERSQALTEAVILDVLTPCEHQLALPIPEHPLLTPIVDAVRADPADGTSLAQWSHRLGVSTRTITRSFETETGMTYRTWVATARAQHAVELLARQVPLEQVTESVGYRSASAFITAFRRITGLTPGQFRRIEAHSSAFSART